MDMSNYQINVSYNIDFSSIPKGMEEDVLLVEANVKDRVDAHISGSINSIEDINESDIQKFIISEMWSECLLSSSAAQTEYIQNGYAEIGDGCIVTVSISQNADTLLEQIKEDVKTLLAEELQNIGGG